MASIGLYAQTACIWEVTARKPGNVHRYRDFDDSSYTDFLLSAAAAAPILDTAGHRRVGQTILDAVRATRRVVTTNTNLGILLLLTPLAAVPPGNELQRGVSDILGTLHVSDARLVYEAIRLAAPAGLGHVDNQDIETVPNVSLREAMALAAERDLVALQYANGFQQVLGDGISALQDGLRECSSVEDVVIYTYLRLMARHPDSLIARKRGAATAEESRARAESILALGWPKAANSAAALAEFDAWLRADGRGRNPGTTADLVAASLFVALREGIMQLPSPLPWSGGANHA